VSGVEDLSHTFGPVDLRSSIPREYNAVGRKRLKERKQIHRAVSLVVVMTAGSARLCVSRLADVPEKLSGHFVHADYPAGPGRRAFGRRKSRLPSLLQIGHFAQEESPIVGSNAACVGFFKRSADCLVAEAVHDAKLGHPVGQKAKAPL